MHIDPFGVEIWMNEWETKCALNLAETCVESMTIAQLLELTGQSEHALSELLDMKMTYGAIEGSERLRTAIAALYAQQRAENVVLTHGTIGANMLVHRALVSSGDRVVAVVPTYQQHYSIPASLGAEVHKLWLREEDRWLPDLDRLRALTAGGARLIALTNPNNPTGALIPRAMLEEIATIARAADAWVLCDEVYRGTDQEGDGATASIADVYEKGVSTAGMSKAFSLAGLRVGWVTAPREVIALPDGTFLTRLRGPAGWAVHAADGAIVDARNYTFVAEDGNGGGMAANAMTFIDLGNGDYDIVLAGEVSRDGLITS
ncbi:MAG: aminotransferase class I/II-fold pyridoxal phosphate-dependent enzyme, partial [Pseudomonadota bacterium]